MTYKYLILDSRGEAVAHGTSEYAPEQKAWRMTIPDGDLEEIAKHTNLELVGNSDAVPALEVRIIRREGNTIVVEPIRPLEQSIRRNLRIPVRFDSFIYPRSGHWKGRASITSQDLSCGGLGFYCDRLLEERERVQVVIPVTTRPLLLDLEILRWREGRQGKRLYSARFPSLLREEESMVREAVFSLQLQGY